MVVETINPFSSFALDILRFVFILHDEITMNDMSNRFITQVELIKISRKFDTRIEPYPFSEADFDTTNPFASEILRKGIQIA